VQSRRLDPEEITGCKAVRYFVELDDDDAMRRTRVYLTEKQKMRDLADYFQVAGDRWAAIRLGSRAGTEGTSWRVPRVVDSLSTREDAELPE
jgi:hypothetical protein